SYPKYLDLKVSDQNSSIRHMVASVGTSLKRNKNLRHILINEGLFEGIISTTKDLIQPILEGIIISSGIIIIAQYNAEDNLNIVLGFVYGVLHIFSAVASRRSHQLQKWKPSVFWLNLFMIVLTITLAIFGIAVHYIVLTIFLFLLMRIVQNYRKPLYVDQLDEYMQKNERATILSIGSQLKSLIIIIIAPVVGYISDLYGINIAMVFLSILVLLTLPVTLVGHAKTQIKNGTH
ncbi:MAG TPA: hypothetical protein VFC68_00065, partial [Treponemataceae bacterium]|nr:hypothetical protein [Treponemataceae bacterium]